MTVSDLLARMPSAELAEWQAYYGLEPFGEMRADLRAGIVASTVANTMSDRKAGDKAYSPADFMVFKDHDDDAGPSGPTEVLFDPDPDKHAQLVMAHVFGILEPPIPKGANPYVIPE